MKKFEDLKVDLKGDVVKSYNTIDKWRKIDFKYNKPVKKSEQYDKWKEENPPKYPGPQQYFKTPVQTFQKKKKKSDEDEGAAVGGEDDKKENFVDRRKQDKKIYKPMKGHIY